MTEEQTRNLSEIEAAYMARHELIAEINRLRARVAELEAELHVCMSEGEHE